MSDKMTWREAATLAIAYARQGVPAGPVAIGWDEAKGGTNKRPLTKHGHMDFATDDRTVAQAFSAARKRLRDGEAWGVGLRPGPAGYVVLDVDVKGEKDGSAALAALEAEHGALPEHPVVTTASGGRHEWLRKRGHVGNTGLADGIDIRSDGGWVVAPGTVTPWGGWGEPGSPLKLSTVPEWPEWVASRLQSDRAERTEGSTGGRWAELDRDALLPGERAALEALEALGGHSAYRASDGTIHVVRPGKEFGQSAQIGFGRPDQVEVFSTSWPGLTNRTYSAEELAQVMQMRELIDGREDAGGTGGTSLRERLKTLGLSGAALDFAEIEHARAEAREALRRLEIPDADPPGTTSLSDLLSEPDEGSQWRVQGIVPAGANVVLSAQAKAGKTTLVNNLIKSLADWERFLSDDPMDVGGLGTVTPLLPGERVCVVDLELDRRTIRRWLRDQKIDNTDRVLVESLRGRVEVFDILDPKRRDAWAAHLRERNVRALIVDPLGPLLGLYGMDENSNSDIVRITNALEALKLAAGVDELILVHHMGHNGERSRGASRLRGWPDVEIRLMVLGAGEQQEPPPDAPRYVVAQGRDVALSERKLAFDSVTRRLSFAAEGGNRQQAKNEAQRKTLLDKIGKRPGLSKNQLCGSNPKRTAVLDEMVEEGLVHTAPGPRNAILHALADGCGKPANCPAAKVAEAQAVDAGGLAMT